MIRVSVCQRKRYSSMKHLLDLLYTVLLLYPWSTSGQFPATCNNPESLLTKTCCPNDCGGPTRGSCQNITVQVAAQWELADPVITDILKHAPVLSQKGKADTRYLWPTVVFEKICVCKGHFWGGDCSDCDFGWTGSDCNTRKTPVVRRNFAHISTEEKQVLISAVTDLKKEKSHWSVIVEEPDNYTSGIVTLQNVSAYDFLVYSHNYAERDDVASCNEEVNNNILVAFAHSGPIFPLWHRHFILLFEREIQRITNNASFGLPYWQWEENDMSPFTSEYFGIPSHVYGPAVNVTGQVINPHDWNTICDVTYRNKDLSCIEHWTVCNPARDLAAQRPLQRGGALALLGIFYLPSKVDVQLALAAPSYDVADTNGRYSRTSPRQSFRNRMEGWDLICSEVNCAGPAALPQYTFFSVHNMVHRWLGGQMMETHAAVNDPIFFLHHSNVDRIVESWIQRFLQGNSNPALLPEYVPLLGGHPGHNLNDYMVPFFPVTTAAERYFAAEELGYTYDELIPADIEDYNIPDCSQLASQSCPVCDANGTCMDCTNDRCFNHHTKL